MDSTVSLHRPSPASSSYKLFQNRKLPKTQLPELRNSPRFAESLKPKRWRFPINVSRPSSLLRIRVRHGGTDDEPTNFPVKVSSNDAHFGAFSEEKELQAPSFAEFITSERVKVAAMLALALALCNADRVVMSVAIVPLSLSHGWTKSFAGIVQSSFLWGYLVSPIAGGTLVDYYGGKVVMAWGVALWSLATFLTPWAAETSLWALLAMRALLGIAEGVALPCMNNMVARWFPPTERARAVGIAMGGFQLGSAIGLTLSPILMSQSGIFGPFVIFGLSGFLWVLVWLSATSSSPDRNNQISKYELDYIMNKRQKSSLVDNKPKATKVIPPFRRLLSKLPTWSLIVANAMHSWGFFIILSWMPIYFNFVYHVDLRHAAWFSAVPWSVMAIMGYLAGLWSDLLIRSGTSITLTRKIMQLIGFVGPGIALMGLCTAKSPLLASAWLTVAVGLKSFSHSGFLVNLQEIAPQYSGVLHGLSNTAGTFAAILGTVGAGFFVELVGSFQGFLLLTSLLYFLSALFYNLFSTGERVNFDEPAPSDFSAGSYNRSSSKFRLSGSYGSTGIATNGPIGTSNFTFEEINKATLKFSPANKVGEGGFGTVYKGELENGTLVAVKRAKKNTYDRILSSEFRNEIVTLSMIEHLNLVRLYGFLEHGDERIIVVEYVSNGTLREHLDGTRGNGLEIAERLDIAIDVAHAITYLHTYTDPPIIHRDIKASNILITEKLRAKVADFGFARQTADQETGATHISTQVKGTAGYLDPEYLRTYQLTEKSDVYSFGVLLVEMMTGRHPIETKKPDNERLTIRWAIKKLKEGEPVLAMDPMLRRNPASNTAVEKVLKLAQQCLAALRHSRPSMRKCGEVLWGIRKEFREKAFPAHPPPTYQSANYPQGDARLTRHITFGIEDQDSYKFNSA